jgi:hypothetical protein
MGQGNAGKGGENRPSVLENISTSQMEELEEHYDSGNGDKAAWDALTESYGWSQEDGQAVWQWFGEKPEGGSSGG